MPRSVVVAAAQMGGTQRADSRAHTLERIVALLEAAAARGAQLVVFPELAFTTFFPRWLLDTAELRSFTEPAMPNPAVQRLFDRARELGVGFSIGYAEQADDGLFNTAILVAPNGGTVGAYRKVHLPGSVEPRPGARFQQLEKRYFRYGEAGFPAWRVPGLAGGVVGMMICNDRRWPEAWRMLGLQGVELVCCGYNSAAYDPNGGGTEDAGLRTFHSRLVVQANAYMNATWAVAVAKAGDEDGSGLIGGSCIVDPHGRVVAEAATLGDEVVLAECDLDDCRQGKEKMFRLRRASPPGDVWPDHHADRRHAPGWRMSRIVTVAAAQLGPIQRAEPRSAAVGRMVRLLERAHARGVQVVVFPELALTTFFPRHYHADRTAADIWFEAAMPSNETAPLFEAARRYGIAFHLGYAERTADGRHFNTAILVNPAGEVMLKYRKVHLPGHTEFDPTRQVQHLEKRYFEVGDLGFPVVRAPLGGIPVNAGLMICNDPPLARGVARTGAAIGRAGHAGLQHAEHQPGRAGVRGTASAGAATAISRSRPAPTRTRLSPSRRQRPAWRTGANCSATRSSSIPRARSLPKRPVGVTNW